MGILKHDPEIRWVLVLIGLATAIGGCRPASEPAGMKARPNRSLIMVDTAKLWVEIADRPDTRQVGLMFRRDLPPDEGMLFVFEEPQILDFWMKNTSIPLDIAFIDGEGIIINIESMRPLDDRPRYRSLRLARYALEVNRGWFAQKGIGTGARIRF